MQSSLLYTFKSNKYASRTIARKIISLTIISSSPSMTFFRNRIIWTPICIMKNWISHGKRIWDLLLSLLRLPSSLQHIPCLSPSSSSQEYLNCILSSMKSSTIKRESSQLRLTPSTGGWLSSKWSPMSQ